VLKTKMSVVKGSNRSEYELYQKLY